MDKQSKYDSLGTRWRFTVYERDGEVVYGINADGTEYRIAPDSFDESKWRIDKWSFLWEAVNSKEYNSPKDAARDLVKIHAVKTRGESADRIQDELRELNRSRYLAATAETPIGSGDGEPTASKDDEASKMPNGTQETYVKPHDGGKKQAMADRVLSRFVEAAKKPTFAEVRQVIFEHLRKKGWKLVDNLKIPHATSPDGDTRLWFKAQAVYGNDKGTDPGQFKNTHSWISDLRDFSDPDKFMHQVERWME